MKICSLKFIFLSFVALVLSPILSKAQPFYTGDLVFVTEGTTDFSDAISKSTASGDSLSFIHVGIINVVSPDSILVIEASSETGVREILWDDFISEAPLVSGKPGIVVKRLTVPFLPALTIENAKRHIGEEYDWYFLPDNQKMYCSELVYESFVNEDNEKIFVTYPMNFRDEKGELPEFWVSLFKELGVEVPEGVEGTNPNQISSSPFLIEVLRLF